MEQRKLEGEKSSPESFWGRGITRRLSVWWDYVAALVFRMNCTKRQV